jgi:intracellular septation protein A
VLSIFLGLIFGEAVDSQFMPKTSAEALRWKPSFVWWLIGFFFLVISHVSPRLMAIVMLAWRLEYSVATWRSISFYVTLFFVMIGIVSPILYDYSEELWFSFKILAVPSGLLMISAVLPEIIHHKKAKQAESQG